jgi:RNA-directed DNA polymerase
VTQDNRGKKPPGVDGIAALTPVERRTLAEHLQLDGNAAPVRRVDIPTPGTRAQRPLGIPTIADRATQGLVTQALEPEWEAKFEPKS